MSGEVIGFALLLVGLLLVVSKLVRVKSRVAQKLFLPSSIIGGGIALLLGPDLLGNLAAAVGYDGFAEAGLFGEDVLEVWGELPGLLISIVFATLFLGERIPRPREAGRLAGPQLSLGITMASGQYVVGLLLGLLVLAPVFGLPAMAGALIEVGFEGGHGTAAGLGSTFEDLGFAEGTDLALGLATVGVVSGVVLGIALINWAVRSGRTSLLQEDAEASLAQQRGLFEREDRRAAATLTVRPASIEPLAIHFGIVALAVLIGQAILSGLQALEQALWVDTVELFEYVPLFPLAMIGGVLVQLGIDRWDRHQVVDRLMMVRIQGLALDVLIVTALATLSLQVLADNLVPFLLLAGLGVAWNVGVFLLLARRIIPEFWFERGIGDLGQSLGVTATGLILMRVADPDNKTPAYEAFGYKQLGFEPFFGGGLITAASVPLIAQFGAVPMLVVMSVLLVLSAGVGVFHFGRKEPDREVLARAESP
ncbi:sodium/glutamate symporter [Egicoccus sp. AB-alg2]|uniref:sodium/glutamate symporter n=1 Tax=Egicoccus sp. AB-alg2 TaxID=3242693 RepID=UPI00359DE90D